MFIRLALIVILTMTAVTNSAEPLNRKEKEIVGWVDDHLEEAFDLLEKVGSIPSATLNVAGVRAVGDVFAEEYRKIDFETSWVELPPEMRRAGHFFAEKRGTKGKRLLLIGHLDTVLEQSPLRREGLIMHGNGVTDMKGGNVIMLYALKALHAAGALDGRQIIVNLTGDEEDVGAPRNLSRESLIAAAKRSDIALAFEGAVERTGTVARRGVTSWRVEVTARGGHSSLIFRPDAGSGAGFELARILTAFYAEVRGEEYLTFNPSVIVVGTEASIDAETRVGNASGKTNVIPRRAVADGDLRFISDEQRERTKEKMRQIVARNIEGSAATITFIDEYPAMSPTPENYKVLAALDQVSRDLGYGPVPALDPSKRGAGDISFVAPFIPGLDGLGAEGDREHAAEEFVKLERFPELVKRAALLIYRLTR